jgi:hypothetical protein
MPTPEQRGRSNRTKGLAWQRACAAWLRENGWPAAELATSNGPRELSGCGDVAIECKNEQTWEYLSAAMVQAEMEAMDRGFPTYAVWRKRHGNPRPGAGWIVQPAVVFWADRRRLEEYERLAMRLATGRPDPITEAVETNARLLREAGS